MAQRHLAIKATSSLSTQYIANDIPIKQNNKQVFWYLPPSTVSSNLHLEAVQIFYPIGITLAWRNCTGPICLQPVSRNRDHLHTL